MGTSNCARPPWKKFSVAKRLSLLSYIRGVCTRNECIGNACPTVLIQYSFLSVGGHDSKSVVPRMGACTQRIRRNLMQETCEIFTVNNTFKDNYFIKQFNACECEFSLAHQQLMNPYFRLRASGAKGWGSVEKRLRFRRQKSNRFLFSWRHNVQSYLKSDSFN